MAQDAARELAIQIVRFLEDYAGIEWGHIAGEPTVEVAVEEVRDIILAAR